MTSLFSRLERTADVGVDPAENRRTELLGWTLERSPAFARAFLGLCGCDVPEEATLDIETQRGVPDYLLPTRTRFVDLSIEWTVGTELLGRVFVEVKWRATVHGDQLQAYRSALRELSPRPQRTRLAWLAPPLSLPPDSTVDQPLTWPQLATLAERHLGTPEHAQDFAVRELLMALEEERMTEPRISLSDLAAASHMMPLARLVEQSLLEALTTVEKRHATGVTLRRDTFDYYLFWSLVERGRLTAWGRLQGPQQALDWRIGVLLTRMPDDDIFDAVAPAGFPLATAYLRFDGKPPERAEARAWLRQRLAGTGLGVELVERENHPILAHVSTNLIHLLADDAHPKATLREFFVEASHRLATLVDVPARDAASEGAGAETPP